VALLCRLVLHYRRRVHCRRRRRRAAL